MGEAVGVICWEGSVWWERLLVCSGGRGQSGGRGCWCDLAGGFSQVGEDVGMIWWEMV